MRRRRFLVGVGLLAAAVAAAGSTREAHAGEPADRGASFSVWAGGALDRSVTAVATGASHRDTAPVFGLTGLGNLGSLALGASIDGTPATLGDGRLSLSGVLGWQPRLGPAGALRVQLLGEVGERRFSEVGRTIFVRQLGADAWLPFVGARLGVARTFPAHGPFELGAWLFGRTDIGRRTVTNVSDVLGTEMRADYEVGGTMLGLAIQGGLRIESSHPWHEPALEAE